MHPENMLIERSHIWCDSVYRNVMNRQIQRDRKISRRQGGESREVNWEVQGYFWE